LRIAACLGAWLALPGLWGNLGGFARELEGLNSQNFLGIRLFKVKLYRLCRFENLQKYAYLGHIAEFERKQFTRKV
jgi:hypothetical protein